MSPPIALITGATDGIGQRAALELVQRGWRVIVHGRTLAKAEAARQRLAGAAAGAQIDIMAGDLGSLVEVRQLARTTLDMHEHIDVLINNAGVFLHEHRLTPEGFEATLAINHLAPFVLTHLLLPALERSVAARILNVSSVAHQRGTIDAHDLDALNRLSGYAAYAASKLANVLFTYELARRLGGRAITVNALHPGVIGTKLLREGFNMGGASLEEGAAGEVRLATLPELARVTGRYYAGTQEARSSQLSHDRALQRRFYQWSAEKTGTTPLPEPAH
ncbi:MAG TPA: SDR family oxidoreductase [Polyangia bacterium]|nr:SDR family oxidoreductase [Polyangia bacterium]